jgi:WD40 repeat protein
MDLKRSWPSCGTDQLNLLLQSTQAATACVYGTAQRSVAENHVLARTEGLTNCTQLKLAGGRTLQDAIVLPDERDDGSIRAMDGHEKELAISAFHSPVLLTQRIKDHPEICTVDSRNLPQSGLDLASIELELSLRASISMRQYLDTRTKFHDQSMHLLSLKRSLQHHKDTLSKLSQDRSKVLTSNQSHGHTVDSSTTVITKLDEIRASEQNCDRVIAQLQRQVPTLELSHKAESLCLFKSRLRSIEDFSNLKLNVLNFCDPLYRTQRPTLLNNRLLMNICHRQLGVDRYLGQNIPRSMGRMGARGSVLENLKGLLNHRMSHAATINTHLSYPVYCLRFDRTGRYFITGADDYLVKLFCVGGNFTVKKHGRIDPATYARGAILVCTLKGHAGVINDIGVSSDNSFLATASEDGDCRVWGLRDGCPIAILRGHVGGANMVSWSTLTPFRLVTTGADGLARTWDIREACLKRYSKMIGQRPEYNEELPSVDIPPEDLVDLASFPSYSIDSVPIPPIPLRNIDSDIVPAPSQEQPNAQPPLMPLNGMDGEPENENAGAGRFVANDNLDEGVKIISRLQHGATLDERLGGPGTRARRSAVKVICIARCPFGGHFATGSDDGICRIWQDDDNSMVQRIDKRVDRSDSTVMSEETMVLPDRLLLTLQGHLSAITDLHYSNRGDRIITASQKDGVVRIWSWNMHFDSSMKNISHQTTNHDSGRSRSTSHILLKLTNPISSASTDFRHGPRARPNRSQSSSICCDVAVWTNDDSKIVTSQSEIPKQSSNDIAVGSQYLFLWDSFTGNCLLGIPGAHTKACPVVLPHPLVSSIICSAGADGVVKLWDWETGKCIFSHENTATFGPIEAGERGKNFGYLDGDFSPDGTTLVLADESGRVTLLDSVGARSSSSSCPEWMKEQYFSNDYYDLFYDSNGYCIERGSEKPPHLAPRGARCSHSGAPFSAQVNDAFKALIGPAPTDECMARWNRRRIRSIAVQRQHERVIIKGNIVRQFDPMTSVLLKCSGTLTFSLPSNVSSQAIQSETPETNRSRTGIINGSSTGRRLSSNYRWRDYSDMDFGDDDQEHETDDEDFELHETNAVARRVLRVDDSESDESMEGEDDVEPSRTSSRKGRGTVADADDSSHDEYVEYVSTNNAPSGSYIADYDLHFFRMTSRDDGNNVRRLWLRRNESSSSYDGRKTYTPQVGDSVVYVPRAHQNTLAAYPGVQTPPWQQWPDESAWPVVRCCIRNIRYRFPYKAYHKELGSVVAKLTLEITGIPELSSDRIFGWPAPSFTTLTRPYLFELALFENKEDDFIIPLGLYVSRLQQLEHVLSDRNREVRVEAFYVNSEERNLAEDPAYVSYIGRIVRFSDNFDDDVNSPNMYLSGFNSLAIVWDDGTDHDPDQVSPWDVSVQSLDGKIEQPERPKLVDDETKRVRDALNGLIRLPGIEEFFFAPVDVTKYSDYATRVEVPMDLTFIKDRLEADYYASRYSVVADVMLIYSNCKKYNGDTDELSELAGEMLKSFEDQVLDADERLLFHMYDLPITETLPQDPLSISDAVVRNDGCKATVQRRKSKRHNPVPSSLENVQGSVPKTDRARPKSRSRNIQQPNSRSSVRQRQAARSVLETTRPQAIQTLEQLSSGRGQRARGRATRSTAPTTHTNGVLVSLEQPGQARDLPRRPRRTRELLADPVYTENDRSDIDEIEPLHQVQVNQRRSLRNVSGLTLNPPHHPVNGRTRESSRSQASSSRGLLVDSTEIVTQSIISTQDTSQRTAVRARISRQTRSGSNNELNNSVNVDTSTETDSRPVRRGVTSRKHSQIDSGSDDESVSCKRSSRRTTMLRNKVASRGARLSDGLPSATSSVESDSDESNVSQIYRKSSRTRQLPSDESEFEDKTNLDSGGTSESEIAHSSDFSNRINTRKTSTSRTSNRKSRSRTNESKSPPKNEMAKGRSHGVVAETTRTSPARNARVPVMYHVPSSSDFDSDDSPLQPKQQLKSGGTKRKGTGITEHPIRSILLGMMFRLTLLFIILYVASPISKPTKKARGSELVESPEPEKWPEVPIKRISEVTRALLKELVRRLSRMRNIDKIDGLLFCKPISISVVVKIGCCFFVWCT